ncbi:lysozyme, partial [Escherichia coli EC1846]
YLDHLPWSHPGGW